MYFIWLDFGKLYGNSLELNSIKECMRTNKIRSNFCFLIGFEIKLTLCCVLYSRFASKITTQNAENVKRRYI